MASDLPPPLGPEATAVLRQFEELARHLLYPRDTPTEVDQRTVELLMQGFALGLAAATFQPAWATQGYAELVVWRARQAGVSPARLRDMDRLWARSTAERSHYTDRGQDRA